MCIKVDGLLRMGDEEVEIVVVLLVLREGKGVFKTRLTEPPKGKRCRV